MELFQILFGTHINNAINSTTTIIKNLICTYLLFTVRIHLWKEKNYNNGGYCYAIKSIV